jgi:hypothetical protein
MESFPQQTVLDAVLGLLQEVCDGPENPRETWVVSNEPASGILGTVSRVSAEQASREPRVGARTIAAHAEHVRFALHASRRWLTEDAPPQIDWKQSWLVSQVDEARWDRLRGALRDELVALTEAIRRFDRWDEVSMKGAMATVAHAAYHLGAIRQMDHHGSAHT